MPETRPEQPAARPPHEATPTGELLRTHGAALRRYLVVLGCRADQLDDLVQETLLVALRRDFAARGVGEARTWLRRTACNLLRNQQRTALRRREVEIADEVFAEQCRGGDGDDYVEALRACVEALPDRQRRLLEHTYTDGLGREHIAARLGMRANGIKTALRRVRAALRACVERKRGER